MAMFLRWLTPSRQLRAWAAALFGMLTLLLGAVPALAQARPAALSPTPSAAAAVGCAHPVPYPKGPFKIAGDHRTVLNANNTPFLSYGTTVPGLSQANFTPADEASYISSVVNGKDIPKIKATAKYWCANTVRLQVSQHDVTQNSTPDNGSCTTVAGQDFLAKALDPEVKAAEVGKLAVVINDQTESDPLMNQEQDPTKATFMFWTCVTKHMESWGSHRTYSHDPNVIFDIFNEPRADACQHKTTHSGYDMKLWRNGGSGPCGSNQPAYQGMDAVAYHIRKRNHATNLLWVEGPGYAGTLAGLDHTCQPSPATCLITAGLGPVVYSIHHPFVASASKATPSTWWDEFGYLVDHTASSGQAPVVVGEWTNIDAGDPPDLSKAYSPFCWPSAPASVRNFLAYLQTIKVGLSAYQLAAGYMLKANKQWTDTTNYTDHTWSNSYCRYRPGHPVPPLLGSGADVLRWFQARD
jgi:hypothetical protein